MRGLQSCLLGYYIMKPIFARIAVLSFLGIMSGISINAIFLQEGRLAKFEHDPRSRDIVIKVQQPPKKQLRHVAAIKPKLLPDRRIEDVLKDFERQESSKKPDQSLIGQIQKTLSKKGYQPGAIDGIAGATTKAAIMAYEFDNGLSLTGFADQGLLDVLLGKKPRRDKVLSKNRTNQGLELVAALQRELKKLGYDTGSADGIFGPMTRKRIKAFEKDQKLKVTGRISGRLIERINKLRGRPIVLAKLH